MEKNQTVYFIDWIKQKKKQKKNLAHAYFGRRIFSKFFGGEIFHPKQPLS